MSILKILQYPDIRLKRKAVHVEDVLNKDVQQLISDMFETMKNSKNCAGLSSTQLDVEVPFAITVLNKSSNIDKKYCLINPRILSSSGTVFSEEACMSVYPSLISAKIKRFETITFIAQDKKGNEIEKHVDGFFARCCQHEFDHLNGVLYIDHLSKLKRRIVDKKIYKYLK